MKRGVLHDKLNTHNPVSVRLFPDQPTALQHAWAMSFEGEATGAGVQLDLHDGAGSIVGYSCGPDRWILVEVSE